MEEKKNANQPHEIKEEELDQVTGGKTIDFKPVTLEPIKTPEKAEKYQDTNGQR